MTRNVLRSTFGCVFRADAHVSRVKMGFQMLRLVFWVHPRDSERCPREGVETKIFVFFFFFHKKSPNDGKWLEMCSGAHLGAHFAQMCLIFARKCAFEVVLLVLWVRSRGSERFPREGTETIVFENIRFSQKVTKWWEMTRNVLRSTFGCAFRADAPDFRAEICFWGGLFSVLSAF